VGVKQIRLWLPFVVMVITALYLWKGLSQRPAMEKPPLIDKPLPEMQATRLHKPHLQVTNNDFLGHVSLLNVFATWCLSCQSEHAFVMDIHRQQHVAIYGLNYKDNRYAALHWLHRHGNPYTKIIFDPAGTVGINLGVYGTPETFLIDQRGRVRYKYVGPITRQAYQEILLPDIKRLQHLSVRSA